MLIIAHQWSIFNFKIVTEINKTVPNRQARMFESSKLKLTKIRCLAKYTVCLRCVMHISDICDIPRTSV